MSLQETLTWAETSARPTSFSAQHVTFFLLRSLVTLTRVSPRDGRSPDFWTREERDIRRVSADRGRRQGVRADVFGSPVNPYGRRQGWGGEGKGEQICDREWFPLQFAEELLGQRNLKYKQHPQDR